MQNALYQALSGAEIRVGSHRWNVHIERMVASSGHWLLTLAVLGRPGRTVSVRVSRLEAHLAGPILARLEVWVLDPAGVDHETLIIEEPALVERAAAVNLGDPLATSWAAGLSTGALPQVGASAKAEDVRSKPVVLLVDDVLDHLRLYKMTLGDRYTVLCASTGRSAYEMACANHPNVVVLDIMLPDMDGWAVCERLRANEATAGTPIVLMTASAASDISERAQGSGAVALLRKPYVTDTLIRTIDASLGGIPA